VLYKRHQQYIWRICYRYVQNPQNAEDLMQEVFFKAYRGMTNFEGRSSFKTWLSRIATRTCLNELRHWERRPQIHPEPLDIFAEFIPSEDVAGPSRERTPELAVLAWAMTRLRPEELEVIQMKDLDERTYDEIAQIQEISLSAAKMRVHRTRLALRAAYLKAQIQLASATQKNESEVSCVPVLYPECTY
jgi:RNA polymerase sigma-70 factor (ECF subfamily)